MNSSFDFLKDNPKLQVLYNNIYQTERLYSLGFFPQEMTTLRNIAEQLVKAILRKNHINPEGNTFATNLRQLKTLSIDSRVVDLFYFIKDNGNTSAHSLSDISKNQALLSLSKMYTLLVWYTKIYEKMNFEVKKYIAPESKDSLYQTSERKLIYIQTADNSTGDWPRYKGLEKIGDATITNFEIDGRPNSDELRAIADKRVSQYMTTAGVPHILQWAELAYRKQTNTWFRDYDVHKVLQRSHIEKDEITAGNEWYRTDLETAKKAIAAVKEGKSAIDEVPDFTPIKITLRPEQQEAVNQTKKVFKKKNKMLWNAKMRFGKTLSALQLIKDEKYQHVLIMTHRPVVSDSWYDDFKKLNMSEAGYIYGSRTKGEKLEYMNASSKPFIYFASIQDLRGSKSFGGIVAEKNELVAQIHWDLVIIDEAHEGTQTTLAQQVINGVVKDNTKLLELSGTPFNLLEDYEEDQVFTWDYVMEQEAKHRWTDEHPDKPNPYIGLPRVNMFTFEIQNQFKDAHFYDLVDKSFNFHEFFRVNDEDGSFVYEEKVRQFLDNITQPNPKTWYPFSTKEFRDELRHTLWLMPSVKSAKAMKNLMEQHPVFGMEYKIINVVDNGDNTEGYGSDSDLKRVRNAITAHPSETKTITLTVRKLTAGINVKEWTAVIFLSNTNSSMQYLQAAFRAQTPFSDEKLGMKTDCYIFDFAPDRALTVMADSSRLRTGVGKRVTTKQRQEMNKLLNFLPIIGESGNGMKEYKVDEMLKQLKRAYAEKAVRTGFDDDSLYSDELLMIKDADLKAFNGLKAIVGTTKAEKKPLKIQINNQGLTNEEYDEGLKAKKKPPKKRTPEEDTALKKMNELKKQRKVLISILRSISIRIPLMIYGIDADFTDDISIKNFVKLVDNQSWEEFMPKGVTKPLFLKFQKFYDADVFIEAGHIIRRKVKELDNEDPLQRTITLAEIFGTFRNPDKETVLTPWRVVNMHFGKTFGGLSFYNSNYSYTTVDGKSALHWINTPLTDKIFYKGTHILEINSKTGLYPLYATTSLYYQSFNKMNEDTAGKFSLIDEQELWQKILKDNIFVVAKTPMAQAITKRTLAGYHDYPMNVKYIDGLVDLLKDDINKGVKKVKGAFGKAMKFDAIVGNPPYQDTAKGENDTFTPSIYNLFMDLSYKLSDKVSLITPARFLFNAGNTPKDWNKKMLNDPHFKVVQYESDSSKIFPNTDIKGGIIISYRDKHKDFGKIELFTPYSHLNTIIKKVLNASTFHSFSNIIITAYAYRLTEKLHKDYPEAISQLSKGHAYDMKSSIFKRLPQVFFDKKPSDDNQYIQILGRENNHRVYKYIRRDYVNQVQNLDKYKIYLSGASGTGSFGETIAPPILSGPGIGATETFISVGTFNTKDEAEAVLKYVKTKFARCLLGVLKSTQANTPEKWKYVPLQDFTNQSDIDWSQSIHDIDQQLYRIYGLTDDEIQFIEENVKPME